jgi:RNA polymerase sigma-70 factor (ECF subfamily)
VILFLAMDEPTRDSVLVRKALGREKGGATKIHSRYRRLVHGILAGMVDDPAVTEDLAQEAFLRAFHYLDRLRDPSCLSAWLGKIARRVVFDFRRAPWARGQEVPAAGGEVLEFTESPQPEPEEAALAREAGGLLEGLAEPFRTTLSQRFLEDLQVADIARRQGIDVPLAKYRIRRGLELLRRQILEADSAKPPCAPESD